MADPVQRYQIAFPRPQTHLYEVTLELDGLAPGPHHLEMAVWTPGSYLVREFSRHVHDLRAEDAEGRPIAIDKERKNVWAFDAAGGVRVRYRVYANEPDVDNSHLDASHAYWNGCSLFMALDGRKDLPVEVTVEAPPDWRVATGLDVLESRGGRIRLRAADYDTLLDCPVEVGTHRTYTFDALGKPHEVALYGHGNEDPERLVADLRRIVEAAGAIFGGLPYERYVFIVHLLDEHGGGGLEHKNSTTCDVPRFEFKPEAAYLRMLSLFSHEFFHLWNVKRIHPEALGPFDYGNENYTTLLWAMEGVTDYYADLILARAGLWSERKYAQMLAQEIHDYELRPGRLVQSAAMSSYDSWIKFYRPDESSPNHTISYYAKGCLLGLCLDLELRAESGGRKSLDDVLRLLYERYGRHDRGFAEEAYKAAVEEVAGHDMDDFWRRHVDGAEPLDLGRYLARAGLDLRRQVARGERDGDSANRLPAVAEDKDAQGAPRAYAGIVTERREGQLWARHVLAGTPAEEAGVNSGDELIALDAYRTAAASDLRARVADHRPGDEVRLTVSRRGEIQTYPLRLGEAPPDEYRLRPRADASAADRAVYEGWLGRPFPPADGLDSEAPRVHPRAMAPNLV